jgi:hypothetical protein
MANLFDQANAPTQEPNEVVIGSFVHWKRPDYVTDYPPALYRLVFIAREHTGAHEIQLTSATAADGAHYFSAASTATAVWLAGHYHFQVEVERISDSARIFLYRGFFDVAADLDTNGVDPRTHAEKMLNAIEALLEGRADKDVSSYSIAGRSISKMSVAELTDWRDYYRREHAREHAAANVAAGKPSHTTIKVRFL